MDVHLTVAVVIAQNAASVGEGTVLAIDECFRADHALSESGGGNHDLERRSRLDHVEDRPVFHLLMLGGIDLIEIEGRPAGHCQNFAGLGIYDDAVALSGFSSLKALSSSASRMACMPMSMVN